METQTKITIDFLIERSVSIGRTVTVEYNGNTVELERTRKAYDNSPLGRQALIDEVGEPYSTAVFMVWGETPTVQDPELPVIVESEVNT